MRVLHIEDDDTWAKIIAHQLATLSDDLSIVRLRCLSQEEIDTVDPSTIDVCLLDLCLPGSQGLATITACSSAFPGVPIVVLSSIENPEVIQECMLAGADEYWVKGTTGHGTIYLALQNAFQRRLASLDQAESAQLVCRLQASLAVLEKGLQRLTQGSGK